MKRLLLSIAILATGHGSMAQQATPELSPVQQYLYNDTGYAPGYAPPPVYVPQQPYETVYAPPPAALEEETYADDRSHLNEGVRGMNF